jgi:hypothetical protein
MIEQGDLYIGVTLNVEIDNDHPKGTFFKVAFHRFETDMCEFSAGNCKKDINVKIGLGDLDEL